MASLLRDKGYNEPCKYYFIKNVLYESLIEWKNDDFIFKYEPSFCIAPNAYLVLEWLRKAHHIHISIEVSQIYYYFTISHIPNGNKLISNKKYETYTEALLDSILYTLNNLI